MRYLSFVIAFLTVFAGGYFLLGYNYEEKYEVLEEDTFPGCEISVIVYMSPYCKYCIMAKELLDGLKVPYTTIDVNDSHSKRAEMIQKTGRKTVPQIYINDHHVGGYDDLKALKDSGKLTNFLKSCEVKDLK